jgi:hypothetical protein
VRHEFAIIGEELADAVHRAAPRRISTSNEERDEEVDRALALLRQLLATARRRSLEGYARARREFSDAER